MKPAHSQNTAAADSGADIVLLWELVADAAGNLRALKVRTVLALLGIAIGTAAVITMLHIGHNARAAAYRQFEQMGLDLAAIAVPSEKGAPKSLPLAAVTALPRQTPLIATIAPLVRGAVTIRAGPATLSGTVIAASDALYAMADARLASGRPTSDLDGFSPYVVVGADIAARLGKAGAPPVAVGERITMNDQAMTVVGLLADTLPNAVLGIDFNNSVILPLAAARRVMPDPQIAMAAARIAPGADPEAAARAVVTHFRPHLRGARVQVVTARALIDSADRQMRIYGLLLMAIGAISLVVGGVGVMNVMLMNVIERRQEIGLRLAIGARRRDIRIMVLAEALLLSAAGCAIGAAVGSAAGWLIAGAFGWPFQAAPMALPLAVVMALVVGLFFGSYPAGRAARLDPIAALRTE